MSLYLDTSGNSVVSVGLCGRCGIKFPSVELMPDPNSPGLMVCRDDMDDLDPYRLPPRATESITITMPRPDDPISTTTVAPGSAAWPTSLLPGGQGAVQLPTTGNS